MKKNMTLFCFFLTLIGICWALYYTGQEHTLVINNKYGEKTLSKNLIIKIPGEKDKKISKNKKAVIELKGIKHNFILEAEGIKKDVTINFKINKGGELIVENFLEGKGEWLVPSEQY